MKSVRQLHADAVERGATDLDYDAWLNRHLSDEQLDDLDEAYPDNPQVKAEIHRRIRERVSHECTQYPCPTCGSGSDDNPANWGGET